MNSWSCCGLPPEKQCYMCGKTFTVRPEYVYTYGTDNRKKWFCSWHCLREYEKKNETKKAKTNKTKDEVLRLLDDGFAPKEIAEKLGIRQGVVYYYNKCYGGLE